MVTSLFQILRVVFTCFNHNSTHDILWKFRLGSFPVSRVLHAELDISNSHLDVPLPFLLFDEPAGESVYAYAEAEEGVGSTTATATNSDTRCSEQDEHYQRQQQQAHENGGHVESTNNTPASKPGVRPSLTAGTSRVLPNSKRSATQPPLGYRPPPAAAAAAAAADGEWGEIVRTRDSPRFALTLRKLTAVKTTLWKRWDLSNFGPLRSLEVSFAGRRTVEQLARKVKASSGWEQVFVGKVPAEHLDTITFRTFIASEQP